MILYFRDCRYEEEQEISQVAWRLMREREKKQRKLDAKKQEEVERKIKIRQKLEKRTQKSIFRSKAKQNKFYTLQKELVCILFLW